MVKEIVIAILGGGTLLGAIFSFLRFIIQRADNRKGIETVVQNEFKKIDTRIDTIEEKMDKNNLELNEKIDCNKAELCRTHILRFADEQRSGVVLHSDEYFKQQLLDIDTYNRYCETHPDFANGLTRMASEYIREEYKRLYLSSNEN